MSLVTNDRVSHMNNVRVVLLFAIVAVAVISGEAALALIFPSAELTPQIDGILQARYDAGDFNGTALIARRGRVVYERSFGLANREWQIPNDTRTKFKLGSITKQFTALLVLQFVNEGKIKLGGHVSEYLPW